MSRVRALITAWAAAWALGLGLPGWAAPGDLPTASDEREADRRARLRLELATAYFAQGLPATALDEVKLALAARPDWVPALNLRGLIYATLGDLPRARESFDRGLELAPNDGELLHNLAWLRCQAGEAAAADPLFDRALAAPGYRETARTLLAQGVCAARQDQMERAEALLQQAFALAPANPAIAMNLADVLLRRGDAARARFHARRVHERPEWRNAESLWLLARIEHRLGDAEAVRELGRQLHARHPDAPETAAFDRGAFND